MTKSRRPFADRGSETLPAFEAGVQARALVLRFFLARLGWINGARDKRKFRALACQTVNAFEASASFRGSLGIDLPSQTPW